MWGPLWLNDGRVRFRLWAPDCDSVTLEIKGREPLAMSLSPDGWFLAEAEAAAGDRYRFRIAPDLAVADPASRAQSQGVHGWSILTDPRAYWWTHDDWTGRPWGEAVIQEAHIGAAGGLSALGDTLRDLADLGVTAVELMPVAAFGGTRNWGYDGVLPYAVAESYGTPEELKAFVDRAHGHGLMVLLDVVYNHFGPDGNYLGAYASDFFDRHVETPWGGAVATEREPVRRFFIDNALMWLDEYRFDGLRFDAVHAIADDDFLDAMAREIRESLPGRQVHLILENEHNDADRLVPGLYDAQWNDDFHNVLHVLLTGESEAYYRGFTEAPTEKLARCLREGFVYQGEHPPGSDKARGKASAHLPTTRFVAFLQNHDQIGNRAYGERLPLLTDNARLRAATALLLLIPQIPLIFMGDAEASRSPFLFFTDFEDDLAEAVREGRRREFAGFAQFADEEARATIPDPNALSTFDISKPTPGPDAKDWRVLYAKLLALRHRHVVPRIDGARGVGADVLGFGAVSASWRMADGATLIIAVNLGHDDVAFPAIDERPFFIEGDAGAPGSFAAWMKR